MSELEENRQDAIELISNDEVFIVATEAKDQSGANIVISGDLVACAAMLAATIIHVAKCSKMPPIKLAGAILTTVAEYASEKNKELKNGFAN